MCKIKILLNLWLFLFIKMVYAGQSTTVSLKEVSSTEALVTGLVFVTAKACIHVKGWTSKCREFNYAHKNDGQEHHQTWYLEKGNKNFSVQFAKTLNNVCYTYNSCVKCQNGAQVRRSKTEGLSSTYELEWWNELDVSCLTVPQ